MLMIMTAGNSAATVPQLFMNICSIAASRGISANLKNVGALLQKKHVYFVPMEQDDPEKKPHSLVADFSLVPDALEMALTGRQMQKIFR